MSTYRAITADLGQPLRLTAAGRVYIVSQLMLLIPMLTLLLHPPWLEP
jgi:hypothetical protein